MDASATILGVNLGPRNRYLAVVSRSRRSWRRRHFPEPAWVTATDWPPTVIVAVLAAIPTLSDATTDND